MIEINVLKPRGTWYQAEKWRGFYTIFHRCKDQMWTTRIQIELWGLGPNSKSFYTAKKVQSVVSYREN